MTPPRKLTDEQLGAIRHYLDTHPQPTNDHSMDAADEAAGMSCLILVAIGIIVIIVLAILSNDAVWSALYQLHLVPNP